MHFLQAGRKRETLPGTEEHMTIDFITALFYEVDEQLRAIPKHPEAHLWPSEVVTLGLLHALKGVGNRPFSRWLTRDYRALFPHLPERTRLFRLFKTHHNWTQVFLAAPTVLGVIDTYGIELIHPMREGRSPHQIGRKGLSNHRWIVGGKLCLLLNQWGLIVGWACATANVADNTFQWLIQQVDGRMIVLSDTGFHAAEGDPIDSRKKIREPDGGGEWTGQCTRDTAFLSDHHPMVLRRRYPPCPLPYASAPLHASNSIAGFSKPMAAALSEWSGVSKPCSRWPRTRAFRRSPRCSTWASKPFATIATPFSSRASRVWC